MRQSALKSRIQNDTHDIDTPDIQNKLDVARCDVAPWF